MLVCYDPADNIHGLGTVTMRETIVNDIRKAAVLSKKVDIATVPSRAGNTPVQAHSFIGNEGVVTEITSAWLAALAKDEGRSNE